MGADLICYVAKGPKKFTKARHRAAERWLKTLWPTLVKANEQWEWDGTVKECPSATKLRQVMRGLRVSEAKRHVTIWVGEADPDDDYLDDVVSSYRWLHSARHTTPARFLRGFLDFWDRSTPRDTVKRTDPDDPKQQIVVAGEMSWGDEPGGYSGELPANHDTVGHSLEAHPTALPPNRVARQQF